MRQRRGLVLTANSKAPKVGANAQAIEAAPKTGCRHQKTNRRNDHRLRTSSSRASAQQVGIDHPLHLFRAGVQTRADRGQTDVYHDRR